MSTRESMPGTGSVATARRTWLGRALARFASAGALGTCPLVGTALAGSNPSVTDRHNRRGVFAPVVAGRPLRFPADHGAHPAFRTEWWYVTAWVELKDEECGVQITFFRSRTDHDPANPSRFAPSQLLLAHAALARKGDQRLRHDQRAARLGFSDAGWRADDTGLALRGWTMARQADDRYHARIPARGFALDLHFSPESAPFPQGEQGFSRKGPAPAQASYYYSRPQMTVGGEIVFEGRTARVRSGRAWLDHEWSSEVLDPEAVGWDWVGLNLDDGTALMAFQIRSRTGGLIWSHARWLSSRAAMSLPAGNPVFAPLREWRSVRSGARYPVSMRITIDRRQLTLEPLFDDQELDARASTGAFYWEGAVRVLEAGRMVGRGYLELTGYAAPLQL